MLNHQLVWLYRSAGARPRGKRARSTQVPENGLSVLHQTGREKGIGQRGNQPKKGDEKLMTCSTCKKDITIEVDHADVNGTDIDYDVERGHELHCTDRNSGRIIHEDWKKRQEAEQKKHAPIQSYEVVVTYRLYAQDEDEAKEQALHHTEPNEIDVYRMYIPVNDGEIEKLLQPF